MADKLRNKGVEAALALLPNTDAFKQVEVQADTTAKTDVNAQTVNEVDSQTSTQVEKQTIAESLTAPHTVNDLKTLAQSKTKKKTLEETKKRATYWLDPGIIKLVEKISKTTGVQKYAVVELAIQELYRQVIG
jgi:hypothetical protein